MLLPVGFAVRCAAWQQRRHHACYALVLVVKPTIVAAAAQQRISLRTCRCADTCVALAAPATRYYIAGSRPFLYASYFTCMPRLPVLPRFFLLYARHRHGAGIS